MGKHHHHRSESDRTEDKPEAKTESNVTNEVNKSRQDGSRSDSGQTDSSEKYLPKTTITNPADSSGNVHQEKKSDGGRVVHIDGTGGRSAELEYDSQNRPVRYRDFNNEEYVNTEPDKADGVWKSKTNRVQDQGVQLSFDQSHKVTMTDNYTKDVVETSSNGVETTIYPPSKGQTTRKVDENGEWISTHDANGAVRSMHIKDNQLQEYTDDKGVTYSLNGYREETKDGITTRTAKYKAVGADQQEIPGHYTVSADRSGNVLVRNGSNLADAEACRRTRVDGTVITSDGSGSVRKVRTIDGTEINTTSSADGKQLQTKSIKYANGDSVETSYLGNEPVSIKRTASGEVMEYTRQANVDEYGADHSYWHDQNNKMIADPSNFADTDDIEEGPKSIQKTPPGVDLQKNMDEASKHRVDSILHPFEDRENGQWFYKKVNYGGEWDFKSPATRSEDGKVITKDQLRMPEYEDYGNWHYAVMGRELGFSENVLEQEAGNAQINHGTSRPKWGQPGIGIPGLRRLGGSETYGDDPHDNEMVRKGYADEANVEKEQKNGRVATIFSACGAS